MFGRLIAHGQCDSALVPIRDLYHRMGHAKHRALPATSVDAKTQGSGSVGMGVRNEVCLDVTCLDAEF